MAQNFEHLKRAADSSKEPRTGVWPASMLFRQYNICMGAALGSQYGAMTVAAEILIAQLHSQSKLTMAWHEKHTTKSRETIPLSV
jgi:hypothetical protein